MPADSRSPYDPPPAPYPGMLAAQFERIERSLADSPPLSSPHDGAPAPLAQALTSAVERHSSDLLALSHRIHSTPELAFEEHEAVAAVAELLHAHGHAPRTGVHGLDTALRAEAGESRPAVAVIAEYDALPGIGHACGHNVIAASAVGAFLALAAHADDLGGRVVLLGTPAEEGGGGKELMARNGAFDDVDAALMVHPSGFEIACHHWLGVQQVRVDFHGLAAHASAMPHLGRNALDAAVAAYQGLAQLRQHALPGDRVHAVIAAGGDRPNIVPHHAALDVYLRSGDPDGLAELTQRAREVFEAAALQTGTQLEADWEPCPVYLPVRNNTPLAARYAENLATRGRRALPEGVVPRELTGSTDMGNVSVRVPSIHPMLQIAPPDVTIHSPEFTEWAASERGDAGVVDGAVALARTAADYLADETLRAATREAFETAGGVIDPADLQR